MVLDGRTDHNHEIEDDRKAQRSKLRQACKRKAVDDITERPQQLIIAECGETENDTLVLDDISTIIPSLPLFVVYFSTCIFKDQTDNRVNISLFIY